MDVRVDDVVVIVDWSGKRALGPLAARCAADAAEHAGTCDDPPPRWSGLLLHAHEIAIAAAAREAPPGVLPHPGANLSVLVGERVADRDGRYQLVEWDAGRRELSVRSDVLGILPLYVWRSPDLLVLATTLKIFRLLPFVPVEVDPEGLAATVTLGYPLGTATLLRGVSVLPEDTVVRFGRDGMLARPMRSVAAGGEVAPGFTGRRAEGIVDGYDAVLTAWTATWLCARTRPLVSLSGGLDSRLALAYVVAAGAEPTTATWGDPHAGDGRVAARVARALHVPHRAVAIDVPTRWTRAELGGTGWRQEAFGAVNLPFYARDWARFLAGQSEQPSVHGFVGDTLGGANLLMYGVDAATVAGPAAAAEPTFHAFVRARAPKVLTRAATASFAGLLRDGLADTALSRYRALPGAHAYQRLIWYDLLYRQRRYVAGAASKLLASYGPVLLPFYSAKEIEFAVQLPADALLDRAASRRLLLRRFPALARIPLTGETRLPAYRDRLHEWADGPGRKIRARRRHWNRMFRTFGHLVGGHAGVVVPTLRRAAPMLDDHLDIRALCADVEGACSRADGVAQHDRRWIMRLFNVAVFLSAIAEPAGAAAGLRAASG